MGHYEKLIAWRRAHALALRVYRTTFSFPVDERYGLTSQIRHAAVAIAANLAEGCGRDTDGELIRFARISLGSANELHYLVRLASDLSYISPADRARLCASLDELKSVTSGLVERIRRDERGRSAAKPGRAKLSAVGRARRPARATADSGQLTATRAGVSSD